MATGVDALVIFGATGDLAKLETFPALVGLVERGVLDVPVVGVAKSGWGLEQFRDYAAASLQAQQHGPRQPGGRPRCWACCGTSTATSATTPPTRRCPTRSAPGKEVLFYLEVPPVLFGRIAQGIATAGRASGSRVMVEKPFGTDLASAQAAERRPCTSTSPRTPSTGSMTGWPRPGGERAVRPVRQRGGRAAAEPDLRGEHPDHHGRGVRRRPTGARSTTGPAPSGTWCKTTCCRCWHGAGRPAGRGSGLDQLAGRQVPAGRLAAAADAGAHRPRPVRGLPRRGGRRPALDRRRPSSRSG